MAALFYGQVRYIRHESTLTWSLTVTCQAKGSDEELSGIAKALDIPPEAVTNEIGAHWVPQRGLGTVPPSDPVVYRLYEGIMVYGQPIKASARLEVANADVY